MIRLLTETVATQVSQEHRSHRLYVMFHHVPKHRSEVSPPTTMRLNMEVVILIKGLVVTHLAVEVDQVYLTGLVILMDSKNLGGKLVEFIYSN